MNSKLLLWVVGVFLVRLLSGSMVVSAAPTNPDDLDKFYSPSIEGEVLTIKGVIDSHIYDYLAREAKALEKVKIIELNSFGGNTNWALEIARKIQGLHKTTRLSSGNFCASACVYLFAAGVEREASADTWLGVHGARLGAYYRTTFDGLCMMETEEGAVFNPKLKGCQAFLNQWYDAAMKATVEAFEVMESSGVSRELRDTYFGLPDDPEWYSFYNVLRKPDWVLTPAQALGFNLVTQVL